RSGPAREKRAGLAKSRPCAFSARHSPHGEKEKRRANPQARPNLGPAERWLLSCRRIFSPVVPAQAGTHNRRPMPKITALSTVHGVWVPACAGTTMKRGSKGAGQFLTPTISL